MSATLRLEPKPDAVLAKAVLRAADQLGLKQAELGAVIGLHRTAISRLKHSMSLDPNSKSGELALLLIRVARALFALTGGDAAWIKHFMRHENSMTGGIPAAQILSIQGLIKVLHFVDAMRGKV